MIKCGVCAKQKSSFVMNNKLVCLHCDELLFDVEIECDEEVSGQPDTTRRIKFKDADEALKNQN